MKKWLTFIGAFVLSLAIFISLFVLWQSKLPFSKQEDRAVQIALDQKTLAQVDDVEVYNGTKSYVTVFGMDENGEDKAVFIPTKASEEPLEEVLLKDGISKKQAIKVVRDEFNVKEVLHTKLGWEDSKVVWEITFFNENDKLNYVYILFENGKWSKRILNL
ncbi:MAG: DUF5590 domain-containing protein [Paenisporosarcina sp.]